ncbi:c-Myc-binding protein-like isoform X2 [Lampris incognitus]|uniref:c-Myc-binding protein-like isoform X2 n=1 Tax=Lampris incognitus TaxID=2546036 RepID=UPI0024B59C0E|nr:c-Myc-binding protein-like isoform X2 [Lampris incognitus]
MAQYRASESKRERFRRYLERSGLLDNLTSVLVELYEESDKPDNPLDFIKTHLGAAGSNPAVTSDLQQELAELQQRCDQLLEENKALKNKLLQYEPTPEGGAAE